jgi:hypothetical protein
LHGYGEIEGHKSYRLFEKSMQQVFFVEMFSMNLGLNSKRKGENY